MKPISRPRHLKPQTRHFWHAANLRQSKKTAESNHNNNNFS